MLITNGSRQCVLKLKEYSDKKNSSIRRTRSLSKTGNSKRYNRDETPSNNNPNSITPLVSTTTSSKDNIGANTNQLNDPSTIIPEDRSLLGRLLNCKPCRQVTENQRQKNVC